MLQIGSDQLDAMLEPWRRRVAWQFTLMLRAAWPERIEPLGQDEAFARVLDELDHGTELGLTDLRDLYLLVSLPVILGWDYSDDPRYAWVETMLTDPDVGPPRQRLTLALEMLRG